MTNNIVAEHRNHKVWKATKSVNQKNPISGHEWTESVVIPNRFTVSRNDGDDSTKYVGWVSKTFRSIAAAIKEIDEEIAHRQTLLRICGNEAL